MPKTNFIPRTQVRKGHKTVLGVVKENPTVSPSGKTMVITVVKDDGTEFTDRMSTLGNMAVFTGA
jgi:hypothetical protein